MMSLTPLSMRISNEQEIRASHQPKVTVDLTADMVMGCDNLIDRVFDFTFDVLGIVNVELRIYEAHRGCSAGD
jgi:hypothetical protein